MFLISSLFFFFSPAAEEYNTKELFWFLQGGNRLQWFGYWYSFSWYKRFSPLFTSWQSCHRLEIQKKKMEDRWKNLFWGYFSAHNTWPRKTFWQKISPWDFTYLLYAMDTDQGCAHINGHLAALVFTPGCCCQYCLYRDMERKWEGCITTTHLSHFHLFCSALTTGIHTYNVALYHFFTPVPGILNDWKVSCLSPYTYVTPYFLCKTDRFNLFYFWNLSNGLYRIYLLTMPLNRKHFYSICYYLWFL